MAYVGNTPTTQSFISGTDYFNGDGATTAFTLTRTVNSVNDIEAVVNNVVQQPNTAYTISGTTITFTSAPSSGTSNIYVRYLSTTTQSITPSQNTVSYSTWNSDLQNKTWSFKNRVINGGMVIDQRNNGASITPTSDNTFSVDRMSCRLSDSSKYSVVQSSSAPAGFVNSLLVTSLSSYSLGASSFFGIQHSIEGFNVADLGWGTANGKTVTLSFWVKSSLTGTFGGQIFNSAAGVTSGYTFSYTITAANTWQQISITISAPPNGTTWGTTNGYGICIWFNLGTGSNFTGDPNSWVSSFKGGPTGGTNLVATNGATWSVTGVQLEVGTQATNFDVRSYGTELQLCQRYYYKLAGDAADIHSGTAYDATTVYDSTMIFYPVTMRAIPTVSVASGTFTLNDGLGAARPTTPAWSARTTGFFLSGVGMSSSLVTGRTYYLVMSNAAINISAEL